jgi:hypothetical protein
MAPMLRRLTLLFCFFALALPVVAQAQNSPFAPLPPAVTNPQQAAPTATTSTTTDDGGLASWQQILIVVGGGILLLGIAWAILSDARKAAPVGETETVAESKARKEEDIKRRKAKNRAAAKRSRAARKRNR